MKTHTTTNEYGISVSHHVCPDCGQEFTVTPAAGNDWGGCLAEQCISYDPSRDGDVLLGFKKAPRTDH